MSVCFRAGDDNLLSLMFKNKWILTQNKGNRQKNSKKLKEKYNSMVDKYVYRDLRSLIM